MPISVTAKETFRVGSTFVIEGPSDGAPYLCVFEDDGDTGYLYAVDVRGEELQILDAVHIYNVQDVVDREKPSVAKIGWSVDGMKAVLLINDSPHAVFDFSAQQGYCRTGFPPPTGGWSGHAWDDAALELFS